MQYMHATQTAISSYFQGNKLPDTHTLNLGLEGERGWQIERVEKNKVGLCSEKTA